MSGYPPGYSEPEDYDHYIERTCGDVLAHAHEVISELRKEIAILKAGIGCVLTYDVTRVSGVCGNTIGADGSGAFSIVFFGDPDECADKARSILNGENLKSFRFNSHPILVKRGDGYIEQLRIVT